MKPLTHAKCRGQRRSQELILMMPGSYAGRKKFFWGRMPALIGFGQCREPQQRYAGWFFPQFWQR
ncbi:MAG: hypothetical protein PVG41_20555 [Desulfobacteraceae bacterium]